MHPIPLRVPAICIALSPAEPGREYVYCNLCYKWYDQAHEVSPNHLNRMWSWASNFREAWPCMYPSRPMPGNFPPLQVAMALWDPFLAQQETPQLWAALQNRHQPLLPPQPMQQPQEPPQPQVWDTAPHAIPPPPRQLPHAIPAPPAEPIAGFPQPPQAPMIIEAVEMQTLLPQPQDPMIIEGPRPQDLWIQVPVGPDGLVGLPSPVVLNRFQGPPHYFEPTTYFTRSSGSTSPVMLPDAAFVNSQELRVHRLSAPATLTPVCSDHGSSPSSSSRFKALLSWGSISPSLTPVRRYQLSTGSSSNTYRTSNCIP